MDTTAALATLRQSNSIFYLTFDFLILYRPHEYSFDPLGYGRWQLKIGSEGGLCKVKHMSRLKLVIRGTDGNVIYR